MTRQNQQLTLPQGLFTTNTLSFDNSDKPALLSIYKDWLDLSRKLIAIGSTRGVNIHEGLTESAFCLEMGMVRTTGKLKKVRGQTTGNAKTSFDAYNHATNQRVQIKASSAPSSPSSFGPASEWDVLYYLDFCRNGAWDGKFDIYEISNNAVYSTMVNKTQTLAQMQAQGKRPRFSIFTKIIVPQGLTPTRTGDLN